MPSEPHPATPPDPGSLDPESLDPESLTRALRGRIARPVNLTLLADRRTDPARELSDQLARVAAAVVAAAPTLVTFDGDDYPPEAEDAGSAPVRPALRVEVEPGGVVVYAALPAGPELAPFAEVLAGAAAQGLSVATRGVLAGLAAPAQLSVFIAASCPHCPQAVRAATALAQAGPDLSCAVIDAQRYPAQAARLRVRSVPVTFIDHELSMVGVVPPAELAAQLASRGGPGYDAARLRSMVEGGRIEDATALLSAGGAAALVSCWRGSATSLRMGLLLAAEQALDEAPGCLDQAVEPLLPLLAKRADPALRGDTVDLLGRTGSPAAEGVLSALLADPDPDLAEAARDGLETIAARRTEAAAG